MFDNTRSVIAKTKEDLKKLAFVSTLVIQLIFIIYHIFSMAVERGIMLVHSLLFAFCAVYLLTYILTRNMALSKTQRKGLKLAFKLSKYVINLASLAVSLVWLANNPDGLTVITIVPVVTLLISILVQFICEFLFFVFSRYTDMYIAAFDADTKWIQNAIDFTKNTIDSNKERIDKVKEFYDEHKEGINKAVSITGGIIKTISSLKKPTKNTPPLQYEDKTDSEVHK